jgi:ABC-2 type transport system ATP-binding protein
LGSIPRRADLWHEIARLAPENGVTILLTTHYLEEADRLAGLLAIVDRGRVVVEGSPDRLKSELRGDPRRVELGDTRDKERVGGVLGGIAGVREAVADGPVLRLRADDAARALPVVLGALDAAGVRIRAASLARPSLDDVYLRHVGRAFTADNQEGMR